MNFTPVDEAIKYLKGYCISHPAASGPIRLLIESHRELEQELLDIHQYCDGDIMCNSVDIANIKVMAGRKSS